MESRTILTCKSFVQIVRDIPLSLFPSGSLELNNFLSGKERMIGGIGNMLFSTSPKLHNGQDPVPSSVKPMVHMTTPHVALNCLIHCCQSKRCSERLFEKEQTRICINVGQMVSKSSLSTSIWRRFEWTTLSVKTWVPGTQKCFSKICRSSGEKFCESNSSQQMQRSD